MSDSFQYDVFLSHSAKDKAVVSDLAERLKRGGLRVWFDAWEIRPGDFIPSRIQEGLTKSRTLVFCMSAHAYDSEWAEVERWAPLFRSPSNKGRRFIPLRLDDAERDDILQLYRYVDWRQPTDEAFTELVRACGDPTKEDDHDFVSATAEQSCSLFRVPQQSPTESGDAKQEFGQTPQDSLRICPNEYQNTGKAKQSPAKLSVPPDEAIRLAGVGTLRESYAAGLDVLRTCGVRYDELPWFLVVGEGTGGKTALCRELLRMLGTPKDINNAFQGIAGTYCLDWWFYDNGVMIDIAGRVLRDRTILDELSKLIRKARGRNGVSAVVIVTSCQGYLRQEFDLAEAEADSIGYRINLLGERLKQTVPVYLMVTKCDLMRGWREFVSCMSQQKEISKQQIMGWTFDQDYFQDFGIQSKIDGLARSIKGATEQHFHSVSKLKSSGAEQFCSELLTIGGPLERYVQVLLGHAFGGSHNESKRRSLTKASLAGIYFIAIPQSGDAYFVGDVFRLKIFPRVQG